MYNVTGRPTAAANAWAASVDPITPPASRNPSASASAYDGSPVASETGYGGVQLAAARTASLASSVSQPKRGGPSPTAVPAWSWATTVSATVWMTGSSSR